MSQKRVLIIDMTHLFYKMQYGNPAQLSTTIRTVDEFGRSQLETIPTTLPSGVIKQVVRWSNYGDYPTICCFDHRGCGRCRKAYFTSGYAQQGETYKGSRHSQNDDFYKSINITAQLLQQGGIYCLSHEKYEADDLIKAAVDKAKEQFGTEVPIDIVTGDQDLVPLVDEQVSVFLSSRKNTWAVTKDLEKRHYWQLTPDNMEAVIEDMTDFKNLTVPYNTVLLKKLLRGKKADDVKGYPKFTPTKYNNLIQDMIADGVDLGNLFRYDTPTPIPEDMRDGHILSDEELQTIDKKYIEYAYGEPKKLTELCSVLSNYLDDDIINHIRFVYNGINLNGAFSGLPDGYNRAPAKLSRDIEGYAWGNLQTAVSVLNIKLPQPK